MPGMEGDSERDRQRRLEALQQLAQRDPAPTTETPVGASVSAALPASDALSQRRTRPRWLLPLVAGVLLVALAAGAVVWLAPGLRGSKAANALTTHVITLPASANLYCPSTPAWSADGKDIAVIAQTTAPPDQSACSTYGSIVNNTPFAGSSLFTSWPYAVAVLDATTDKLLHSFSVPDPTPTLCTGLNSCSMEIAPPASLSWSPDGKSIAVYLDRLVSYSGPSGQQFGQERGALEVVSADGSSKTRVLLATGRAKVATNNVKTSDLYSPPLFAWDLTTGAGSYTDIHEAAGFFTIPYAPAYQISGAGQITPLSAPTAGALSPWSFGALQINGKMGGAPNVQLNANLWAWSADGRYVVPNLETNAYLNIPGLTVAPSPNLPGFYDPPFIAPPDAATAALAHEVATRDVSAYVARDPHGARLASFICEADTQYGKLTLRATATGKTLMSATYQFPTLASSLGCPGDAEAIVWAPDGTRIAMTDVQDKQIVIWRIPASA
jgi:hypothetical protein